MGGLKIKAVILAAGKGERFGDSLPKPLAKLFEKPLIEYIIESLEKVGISEIIVVYHDERVRDFVRSRCKTVYNPHVERGEGYSLLLGAKASGGGPFLLLMSDHFFDREILSRLLNSNTKSTTLCIDKDIYDKDLDEATKVLVEGSKIISIGKNIKKFNAIDTGIFLCTNEVTEIAGEFEGKFTVTDVMSKLSQKGKLLACDVTGFFWRDIDTKEELIKVENFILKSLVKPSDGIISRHINRKLSIPLSRLLVKTRITPNQMTFVSFFFGILSAVLFGLNKNIYAGIFAQITSILDGCDGEIARIKGTESKFGAYFDSITDRYADIAIILGMIATAPDKLWLIGSLALLGTYSISYSVSRMETLANKRFIGGIAGFMTRDVRLFIIMIGGLFNQIFLTLLILAIFTNFVVLSRILSARKVMEHVSLTKQGM
jgi:CDP-L-myo-inositol myo-inositolphosphotransferase